jgi:hypothetical protein
MHGPARDTLDRQWYIAQRWQEFEGEGRANLLRIIAIGGFYLVHLANYYQTDAGSMPEAEQGAFRHFHVMVTTLAVAWTMVGLGVLLCLKQQIFPRWLKYISTGADVLLITSVLCISKGPQSPLVVGFFLIVALSALRFSLPLVWFATAGSLAGYVVLLGCAKWPERFGKGDVDIRVPRYEQAMTLLAIALAGVMIGQVIRRARALAEDFSRRLAAAQQNES